MASVETLEAIVELQTTELTRLLRERDRLEAWVERLMEQAEREQVLRQQMQATIDRLVENTGVISRPPAIASANDAVRRLAASERRYRALAGAVGHLVTALSRRHAGRPA
ncbi:MAG: hypothetical protein FJX53_03920 [Alphaproteobacteria bacterium]|nr:hypothetical protein [Alphaproteobacteria bacterium]